MQHLSLYKKKKINSLFFSILNIFWYLLGQHLLYTEFIPFYSFRVFILRLFFSKIGKGVVIKPRVKVKFPWKLSIGDNSWIGELAWIDNLAQVSIGSDVCISQGVYICTGNHNRSIQTFDLMLQPVSIQNQSWVGAFAKIAPNVTIGESSVICFSSVVTENIPPFSIVQGNPAKVIGTRELLTK